MEPSKHSAPCRAAWRPFPGALKVKEESVRCAAQMTASTAPGMKGRLGHQKKTKNQSPTTNLQNQKQKKKKKPHFPDRESNPGRGGESAES